MSENIVIVSVPQSANSAPPVLNSPFDMSIFENSEASNFGQFLPFSTGGMLVSIPNANASGGNLLSQPAGVTNQLVPRSGAPSVDAGGILVGAVTGLFFYHPSAGASDSHFLQKSLLSVQRSDETNVAVGADVVPVATVAITGGSVAALSAVFSLCIWVITGFAPINPAIAILFLIASIAFVLMGIILQRQGTTKELSSPQPGRGAST